MAFESFTPGPKPPFTAIYDQDYFSGSQVSIYVGDIWVDEITSFSYSVSQSKTPVYGYASQLVDTIAPGHVLVEGSFTINYKEQGYLWAVLARYKDLEKKGNLEAPISAEKLKIDTRAPSENANAPTVGHKRVALGTIEQLLGGNMTKNEIYERYLSIAGYATSDTDSPQDKAFENIVEVFEDQIWGDGPVPKNLDNQIRRTDDNRLDNFDIYVVFGNYQNDMSNHTAQKISGVHLTSQGKQIFVGGAPIQEEYTFIAKTVV